MRSLNQPRPHQKRFFFYIKTMEGFNLGIIWEYGISKSEHCGGFLVEEFFSIESLYMFRATMRCVSWHGPWCKHHREQINVNSGPPKAILPRTLMHTCCKTMFGTDPCLFYHEICIPK